jgi:hypothetical protein
LTPEEIEARNLMRGERRFRGFASRDLTERERRVFAEPLSVIELLEAVVVLGPQPDDFAHLLRRAEVLLGGLPPELLTEELAAIDVRPRHYTPLAWAVSHLADSRYREAMAGAGWVQSGGVDSFADTLGRYLRALLDKGRAAHYRLQGWLGGQRVDLDPGWFVAGNLRFDALVNAVVMADGRRITGIEARLELGSPDADDPPEDDNTNPDDDTPETLPPTAYQLEIRTLEASAWLTESRPQLPKEAIVNDLYEKYKKQGVKRREIEKAFSIEVPPDRQRGRGRPLKK